MFAGTYRPPRKSFFARRHRQLLVPSLLSVLAGCTEPQFSERDDDSAISEQPGDAAVERDAERDPSQRGDASRVQRDEDARTTGQDAGADATTQVPPDSGPPSDAGAKNSCPLRGTFAVRNQLAVEWPGTTFVGVFQLVVPGSGTSEMLSRVTFGEAGRETSSQVHVCNLTLPEFAAGDYFLGKERYGFYIPETSWDGDKMPSWDLAWDTLCTEPGCRLISKQLALTFGAQSFDFAAPTTPLQYVDHDADSFDAMSILARAPSETSSTGEPFAYVPLSWNNNARTGRIFAVLAFAGEFDGTLSDCDNLSGNVNQTRLAIRAAGCRSRPNPGAAEQPCSATEVRFLSDNMPVVRIASEKSRFEAKRIADDADCAAVRAAFRE